MAFQINLHHTKTQLSKLVERALAGEEIIIARAGKPLVRLTSCSQPIPERVPGALKGRMWIADDFDQTSDEIVRLFEGEDAGE
jgi:prevent-host-death family protein